MIEMSVEGIALDARSAQPIVILNDPAKLRALPIWIGPAEAGAISRALGNQKADRPMTHDLLLNLLAQLHWAIEKVEINELSSSTYFATIYLKPLESWLQSQTAPTIDARPSDAIALAILAKAPILVSAQVVAEGTIPADLEKDKVESEQFRQFLENVKASDFKTEGLGDIGPPDKPKPGDAPTGT